MERFFMLSLLPLTIFAGYALSLANKKFRIILFAVLISVGIYDAIRRFGENIVYRQSLQIYDTGKNVFRHLPRGAMLIADRADETEFALAYLMYAHGLRKDIDYVDANAGVTRSVYGDDYYKIWGRRRLDIRNIVESRLIREHPGPVYYATLLPGQTSTPKNPSGMLYVSKGAVFDHPEAWKYVLVPPRGEYLGDEREVQMYVNYYNSLADYYLKVNRFEDSLRFYKNSLSAAGRWNRWGLNPAYELHRAGYLDMAEEMYRGVIERHSGNTQALNNLGAIYNESGRLNMARDAFERLVSIDPNSAEGYYNLSIVEWKQNNNAEAIKNLEKAVAIKPDYQEALSFLIKLGGGR